MSGDEFKIDDRYEEYTYSTKERNKGIGSALFGGLATIGAAIATGGASLVVIAGATGAYLGSKAGEMTGSQHTEKVNVGDNKEEVMQHFKEKQIDIHIGSSKKIYDQIKSSFFNPLKNKIEDMKKELDKFENSIKSLKKELS
jgi:phage tail tape-measure protein